MMNCVEPDTNTEDDIGDLQVTVLHRATDLAVRVSEDPTGRAWVDPEIYRQTMCAMRAIARTCGFNADT